MRKFKLFIFIAIMFFSFSTNIIAESKWDVKNPERLVNVEDDIIVTYDLSKVKYLYYIGGEITVNVTIKESYNGKKIVIAPNVFEEIANKIYEYNKEYGISNINPNNIQYSNPFQAGDSIRVVIVINNLSKYDYEYDRTSFEIFPTEPSIYGESSGNSIGKFFNGIDIKEGYTFRRLYNSALKALIPDSTGRLMTDEVVGEALSNIGYNGIEDYDKYLLDFYNKKYNTGYSRLDEFPRGIIREIFSDIDPIYQMNSAYRTLGLFFTPTTSQEERISKITEAIKERGYDNLLDFILDYYNNDIRYNCNGTCIADSIVSLSKEAQDDFFSEFGSEKGDWAVETNATMLALAYDYFYNEGLAFYFDEKDEATGEYVKNSALGNSNNNGTSYSIGEYMRDNTKGDEEILERAGKIGSGSVTTISGVLKNIGNYTKDAYVGFDFMVRMQLTFSRKEGTLVINHVDKETNERLTGEEVSTDLVGNSYTTSKRDFMGYEYSCVDGEEVGEYIDGVIYVTYYYTKTIGSGDIEVMPPQTGVEVSTNYNNIVYYKKRED